MSALETARSLYAKAKQSLSRPEAAHDPAFEARSLHFTSIACQYEAASSLAEALRAEAPGGLLAKLGVAQSALALGVIRSKIAECPTDYGAPSWDDLKGGASLSAAEAVALGKAIVESGKVPELDLDEDHQMIRETFRKLADTAVAPIAEKIHRNDELVPESLIEQLRDLGCFGLSIPEKYGGFQVGDKEDFLGMGVVTEELSRGSLGAAGSLITRPEILARALLKGGTEAQKRSWLPRLATGEKMGAIAVTEPDHGSDVAGIRVTAIPSASGRGWLINGTKTWCTFAGRADVLAVLARTSPDMSLKHKGLSLLLVEKPQNLGHSFSFSQDGYYFTDGRREPHAEANGSMDGRAIPTLGYRGMHSFEVKFENWFVPYDGLVGGKEGLGKGFYLQMEGFAAGRLQTAARANGLMHAALEQAIRYGNERMIFGKPVGHQPATAQKFTRMAATLLASRALTNRAAAELATPTGTLIAAMAKLYASQSAEWVCREAQQVHGGMGYAEEFAVSRYFVDARVLSIFEGAEEVLAVKVIAPALLKT